MILVKSKNYGSMKESDKDLVALLAIPILVLLAHNFSLQGESLFLIGTVITLILVYVRLIKAYNAR